MDKLLETIIDMCRWTEEHPEQGYHYVLAEAIIQEIKNAPGEDDQGHRGSDRPKGVSRSQG